MNNGTTKTLAVAEDAKSSDFENMPNSIIRIFCKFCYVCVTLISLSLSRAEDRPNILYIVLEDITPMMGCYGDDYAKTPVFDQLAAEGIRYTNAHSVAPVCSVSRSSVVTGMYPSTIGTMHHRSGGIPAPNFLKFVPNLMGDAGYYTTNRKGDFNIVGMKYSSQAKKKSGVHSPWRSRPEKNQPFFCKLDFGECHSSVTKTPEDTIVKLRLNRLMLPMRPINGRHRFTTASRNWLSPEN